MITDHPEARCCASKHPGTSNADWFVADMGPEDICEMTTAIDEDGEAGDFFVHDLPGELANFGLARDLIVLI